MDADQAMWPEAEPDVILILVDWFFKSNPVVVTPLARLTFILLLLA